MKILPTLIAMGSTALVSAVPDPGKMTQISHKGQRSNKLKTKYKEDCLQVTPCNEEAAKALCGPPRIQKVANLAGSYLGDTLYEGRVVRFSMSCSPCSPGL